jgi:membrane protease YdiL (CAAX protease family)
MSEANPEASPTPAAETAAVTLQPPAESAPVVAPPVLEYPPKHHAQLEQEFRDIQRTGGFYAAMLLPILVASGWGHHTGSTAIEIDFWAAGLLYLVIAVYATRWRQDWWGLVRLPAAGDRRWLIAAGLAPLVTIGAAMSLYHCAIRFGFSAQDLMHGFGGDGYPVWVLAVWLIVLAPVFEEVAFRGVLMARLQRVMSPAQAIWVTATLFGVVHFSVLGMAVFLVPLAAVAGYLTRETKSLLPAIAIHAAHNAGVFFLSL